MESSELFMSYMKIKYAHLFYSIFLSSWQSAMFRWASTYGRGPGRVGYEIVNNGRISARPTASLASPLQRVLNSLSSDLAAVATSGIELSHSAGVDGGL